jgi:hypothetical protein
VWVFDRAELDVIRLESLPTVPVFISSLILIDSPRRNGIEYEHCRTLVASGEDLPPILVHGRSMHVIDGLHRVRAAVMRGQQKIYARIFDGTAEDAFVLAVRLNLAHGLPLSRADRTAAAARIIQSHPQWSNRMIAAATALSAGTIAGLRQRSTAQDGQSVNRVGKDGRVRPVNGSSGRLRAWELLQDNPTVSIREIAQQAGVSPSTAHDVRKRLRAGEDPVPASQRAALTAAGQVPDTAQPPVLAALARTLPSRRADPAALVAQLSKDPTFRYSSTGRHVIQWLDGCRRGIDECAEVVGSVPAHSIDSVVKIAQEYAMAWAEFATKLERREI